MKRFAFVGFWILAMLLAPLSALGAPALEVGDAEVANAEANHELVSKTADQASGYIASALAQASKDELTERSSYTFAAVQGDGITHLARKAVHRYLDDTQRGADFVRSQKVYLEDYLQNRIGTYGLALNEAKTFTVTQLEEALEAVGAIEKESLTASLARFVERVDWEPYEALAFSEADDPPDNEDDSSETTDDTTDSNGQGSTDSEAAGTENEDESDRQRTITYIVIVIIVLLIAGYLLFRGTKEGQTGITGGKQLARSNEGDGTKPKNQNNQSKSSEMKAPDKE